MKKIFTLFLGAVVALSTFAAPAQLRENGLNKHVRFSNLFNSQAFKAVKAPASTMEAITITCDNMIETTYMGYYPLLMGSNDSYAVQVLLFPAETATDAFGTYSSAAQNIMLIIGDPNNEEDEGTSLVVAAATYSETAEGLLHFVASASDEAGNTYAIDMTGEPMSEYEYDEDADFTHTFPTYTVETKYLAQYGDIVVEALDGTNYLILDIYPAQGASALSQGEYAVALQANYQTVSAGYYDATYGGVPSYAAILQSYNGEMYLDKVWWIVSGKVTVNADGSIVVEAKNSLDHTINATLVAEAKDAVEDVKADSKAVKAIRNGQVVILRNGVEYNLLGAEVK